MIITRSARGCGAIGHVALVCYGLLRLYACHRLSNELLAAAVAYRVFRMVIIMVQRRLRFVNVARHDFFFDHATAAAARQAVRSCIGHRIRKAVRARCSSRVGRVRHRRNAAIADHARGMKQRVAAADSALATDNLLAVELGDNSVWRDYAFHGVNKRRMRGHCWRNVAFGRRTIERHT